MHTVNKLFLDLKHEGITPQSWGAGDSFHQKAKFIAQVAWSLYKDAADPELQNCELGHQERCIGEVESLMDGNSPGSEFGKKAALLIADIPKEQMKR